MELERNRKLETLKYYRNIEEQRTIPYRGKEFDFDETSIVRLLLLELALRNTDNEVEWTCADDSAVMINHGDVVNLARLAVQRANALHQKHRVLRDRVRAATTLAEIESIVW